MQFVDLYPYKSFFQPGETVCFFVKLYADKVNHGHLRVQIYHLQDEVDILFFPVNLKEGYQQIFVEWRAVQRARTGFGVEVALEDDEGKLVGSRSTSFDVLHSWLEYPRYGFVTDFTPGREDVAETMDLLVHHHINGLQFYDWGYRHDSLLPATETFLDPLNRKLSLKVISQFIAAAHARGIAAMPYLAVYAASLEFWRQHKDWGLFDQEGNPLMFEDFLALMDPSPGSPWSAHLLEECDRLVAGLPFDGFHVDQYGEPKIAFNFQRKAIDLPDAFKLFISSLKDRNPEKAVTFNAVGNWPIEYLASSNQDFNYIEVWPDSPQYLDLYRLVSEAQLLSESKPVVIALYQPAEHPANILLANALIFASGGTRIQLGERERWLSDPYFPKHQQLTPKLLRAIRRYNEFCVRYGEWLGPWNKTTTLENMILPEGIWSIIRETTDWLIINLINTSGLVDLRWDQMHDPPNYIQDFQISFPFEGQIQDIWSANPDSEYLSLSEVHWQLNNGRLNIEIDSLNYWSLIAVNTTG
jgi:dextranase